MNQLAHPGSATAADLPRTRSGHVFNLCFHGIGTPGRALEVDEERYWVDVDQFDEILALAHRYPFLRVTFDDGNASDVEHALPLLLHHGLTATFFVCAERLDQPGSLSSADVRELVRAGMTIGSHGLAHRPWRTVDDDDLRAEMNAAQTIADVAGVPVLQAACPFGSYDRRVLRALRCHGFSRVYTVDEGHARANAWLQSRYTIRSWDSPADIERRACPSHRNALADAVRSGRSLIKRVR
jgi:peptidoglycan/xylan/chitin deacetylase (PgdA/CDA1 family)